MRLFPLFIYINTISTLLLPLTLQKRYLSVKMIGGRMFVSREELEELLTDDDNAILPLS